MMEDAELLLSESVKTLRLVQGDAHPNTLSSIHNFAGLLWKQGRLDEAEALFRETVAGLRLALGAMHASTQRSAADLKSLLDKKAEQGARPVKQRHVPM